MKDVQKLASVLFAAVLLLASFAGAQEPEPQDAGDQSAPSDREKRILDLFTASTKSFDKDRIALEYNFESMQDNLVDDWKPALNPANLRLRWSRGLEGTMTTVEHGIIVGDFGEFIHKAVFLADVEVTVDVLQLSQHKAGNVMAAVFVNEKKKRSIGVSGGSQAVCLSGSKLAKPPIPAKAERVVGANTRHKMGFKYDGKSLECSYNEKKTTDTGSSPKFVDGFDTGRIGLAWSGSLQFFIFKVSVKGRLDPAWVASQLGEAAPDKAKKGDKKAEKSSTGAKKPKDEAEEKKGASKK